MRKLFLGACALLALGFTSCKKEYTCKCTTSGGGSTEISTEKTLPKQSLKDAREECDKGDFKIGELETDCRIVL